MSKTTPIQEIWLIFQEGKILLAVKEKNAQVLEEVAKQPSRRARMHGIQYEYELPNSQQIANLASQITRQHEIGKFNHMNCFCGTISPDDKLPEKLVAISLRKAFEFIAPFWYTAITKAFSIINWDKTHQYCGFCGYQTVIKPGKFEKICPHCGLVFYPRISPSIIVLIKKGQEILMARSHHFPPGVYGLIAGFVEAGESIEDTLHREVYEEVGITIKNLKYFGSQSWPFPDSLMIGFTAEYKSGDLKIDPNELEDAGWYHYDKIPGRPKVSISIASKLIDAFIQEQA